MQSNRKCLAVNGLSHQLQLGCSSRVNIHELVILVCTIRSRVRSTTSSRPILVTTDLDSLIIGLISFSLLKSVSFQEVCHLSKMYLFMNGLKLLKGILKTVCSKFKDYFAFFVNSFIIMYANMTWDPAFKYSFMF